MTYRNLAEVLRCQAERCGPCTALRFKRHGIYHDLTWTAYAEAARACAAALIEAGIAPGDRVGLLSENRVEWLIADMGILTAGAVNVPPHAPLTAAQVHYELEDAGVRWLFVSTREQRDKVRQIQHRLPLLKGVVMFDSAAPQATTAAGWQEFSWAGFVQRGRLALARLGPEIHRRERELGGDDLA